MNTNYEMNLSYIEKCQPQLYKTIVEHLNTNSAQRYELTSNENGSFNIYDLVLQSFIYSKYAPDNECQRWVQTLQIDELEADDIVVYGMGLTYHVAALLEYYPNARLHIYEPEIELFVTMMNIVELKALFEHPQIMHISIGKQKENINEFLVCVSRYASLFFLLVEIPFYEKIDLNLQSIVYDQLKKNKIGKLAESGYYKKFGNQMFVNIIRNLPKMLMTNSFDALKDRFKDSVAVVVGGGPSLEIDIEHIRTMKDQWLIIAAGSSVQSLLHFGVTPHLIVSMDPGQYNANVFNGADLSNIPLLYLPQIHYEILDLHPSNNVYAYYSNDAIINMLIPLENSDYQFQSTYSVTGTAMQAAAYMGASTILLAGQDLSYPGKQMYAAGANHIHSNPANKAWDYEVDNVLGEKNPTTNSMLRTLENIEALITEMNNVRIINITSQGAVIKGAGYEDPKLLIQNHSHGDRDFDVIKSTIADSVIRNDMQQELPNIINKMSLMVSELSELRLVCEKVKCDLKSLKDLSRTRPNKAVKLLAELENYWAAALSTKGFLELIEHWMVLELNDYDRRVIEIEREQQLIKKIELLNQILGKFVGQMLQQLPLIKDEFEVTLAKLKAMQ